MDGWDLAARSAIPLTKHRLSLNQLPQSHSAVLPSVSHFRNSIPIFLANSGGNRSHNPSIRSPLHSGERQLRRRGVYPYQAIGNDLYISIMLRPSLNACNFITIIRPGRQSSWFAWWKYTRRYRTNMSWHDIPQQNSFMTFLIGLKRAYRWLRVLPPDVWSSIYATHIGFHSFNPQSEPLQLACKACQTFNTKMYGSTEHQIPITYPFPTFREAVEPAYSKMYCGKSAVKTEGTWRSLI